MKSFKPSLPLFMGILSSAVLILTVAPVFACTISPITQPIAGRSIAQAQPELQWNAAPDAQYRVQISVVAPEARVLMSIDTTIKGNSFKLPSAVPSNFAAVKVLVSQNCPQLDAQDLNAQGPAFFVYHRDSCVLGARISRSGQDTLVWGKSIGASEYIVRLFTTKLDSNSYLSSELSATHRISETQWQLPSAGNAGSEGYPKNSSSVATVQPICDGHPGIVQSLFLQPPTLRN